MSWYRTSCCSRKCVLINKQAVPAHLFMRISFSWMVSVLSAACARKKPTGTLTPAITAASVAA